MYLLLFLTLSGKYEENGKNKTVQELGDEKEEEK